MAETLLLVSKIGVLGSEPYGLFEALTEEYQLVNHNPYDVHLELYNTSAGMRNRSHEARVKQEMLSLTESSLADEQSVFYDAYVNNAETNTLLARTARALGALSVPIFANAPMSVIKERIEARYELGKLPIPEDQRGVGAYIKVANDMRRNLKAKGNPNKIAPNHLAIDGLLPVTEILPQVRRFIDHNRS